MNEFNKWVIETVTTKNHPFFKMYVALAAIAAVCFGIYEYQNYDAEVFVKSMHAFKSVSLVALMAIGLSLLIVIYAMVVDFVNSVQDQDVQITDDGSDLITDDNDLIKASKRLSTFLREVDMHKYNVPIGICFETNNKDTCTIKWSLEQLSQPTNIVVVARELNKILDELELTYAIPIDEY